MTFSLVYVNGSNPGASVELDDQNRVITIGREASRDIPIDDHLASRLHARLSCKGDSWLLEDCGSRNGTLVNGQPIQQTPLQPGDLIRIGQPSCCFCSEVNSGNCPSCHA